MPWKTDLKREIEENHLDVGIFTLQELYRYSYNNLQLKYPKNKTIEARIRQTLQVLRDEKYLLFLGRGEYKVLSLENDEFINFVNVYHES
jgi:type II restriction enzyme